MIRDDIGEPLAAPAEQAEAWFRVSAEEFSGACTLITASAQRELHSCGRGVLLRFREQKNYRYVLTMPKVKQRDEDQVSAEHLYAAGEAIDVQIEGIARTAADEGAISSAWRGGTTVPLLDNARGVHFSSHARKAVARCSLAQGVAVPFSAFRYFPTQIGGISG